MITGALLAGGRSQRMGRDKCLLESDGHPLWQRQIGLLESVTNSWIVIAPQRPAWCPEAVPFVPDVPSGEGPLRGLAAALEYAGSGGVMVLAVDLPGMNVDYLQRLRELAEPNCGVVPEMDGFHQPLSAIYPVAASAETRRHLLSDDCSFQNLIRELISMGKMRSVPVSNAERPLFRNLNTPTD